MPDKHNLSAINELEAAITRLEDAIDRSLSEPRLQHSEEENARLRAERDDARRSYESLAEYASTAEARLVLVIKDLKSVLERMK